jgi:hypothetical protein
MRVNKTVVIAMRVNLLKASTSCAGIFRIAMVLSCAQLCRPQPDSVRASLRPVVTSMRIRSPGGSMWSSATYGVKGRRAGSIPMDSGARLRSVACDSLVGGVACKVRPQARPRTSCHCSVGTKSRHAAVGSGLLRRFRDASALARLSAGGAAFTSNLLSASAAGSPLSAGRRWRRGRQMPSTQTATPSRDAATGAQAVWSLGSPAISSRGHYCHWRRPCPP